MHLLCGPVSAASIARDDSTNAADTVIDEALSQRVEQLEQRLIDLQQTLDSVLQRLDSQDH